MSDFREVLYTIDKRGHRRWVYSALVKGRFFLRRSAVVYLLMAFYLVMPWIVVHGEQGIHLDIPGRRFVFFGQIFWATDTGFLALLLGGLALSLFFFTSILGRVWCGWACPETVFLEFLFRPIERWIEGSPAARLRLDMQPWNAEKAARKAAKYLLFILCAWVLASTFLAYFIGRTPLLHMMMGSPLDHLVPFSMTIAMMALVLFQFGWFREQFCTVLCPYARFQSVLMDADSLTVGYDSVRGEPRGKVSRKPDPAGPAVGDCIDCGLCVRVCPTGIDIRNGLQLECISCAACVDACDSVMDQLGRPRGLVRYATERELKGTPGRWIRPRVLIYAALLFIIAGVFSFRLSSREMLEAQILRGANDQPYSTAPDGRIINHLSLRIGNKSRELRLVSVSVAGSPETKAITPIAPYPVPAESIQTIPLFLEFDSTSLQNGRRTLLVTIDADDGFSSQLRVTVLGPGA